MADQPNTNGGSTNNNNNGNNSNRKYNNRRNNIRRSNNNNYRNNNNKNKKEGFKGECNELKGHVYFIGSVKQADNFNNTTEAILSYIQRTYDYGNDTMEALENLQEKDFMSLMPKKPNMDKASEDEKEIINMILKSEVQKYVERKQKYDDNMNKAYALLLGQCTKGVKAKLESRKDWESSIKNNCINLLKALKEITFNYQDSKYPIESIYFAIKNVFTIKQEENERLTDFTKRFNNAKDIMETQHGKLNMEKYLITIPNYENKTESEKMIIANEQYNKLLAFAYLKGLDSKKCGKLIEDLGNNYALGDNKFPKSISSATDTVINYKNNVNNPNNKRNNNNNNRNNNKDKSENVSFGQAGKNKNNNNKYLENIECYHCHKKGHYAKDCPDKNQSTNTQQGEENNNDNENDNNNNNNITGTNNLNIETNEINERVFNQDQQDDIMKDWILLDNCSTTDIFCDEKLLNNIHRTGTTLNLKTNGGLLQTNMKGTFQNYGDVWYDARAITNILSLYNVSKKYKVKFDSGTYNKFKVYTNNKIIEFIPSPSGLYYYDNKNKDFNFMETVEENKRFYTDRQIERAKTARKLYNTIGNPSVHDFKNLIKMNSIKNCPVTIEDINIAENIFGKDISTLKGKTTRTKPIPVVKDLIAIPTEIKMKHEKIELCADIMFIQGLAFLTTISKKIKFRTIEFIPKRTVENLYKAFDNVFRIYNASNYEIIELYVDPEFKALKDTMQDIDIKMNYSSAQEHVPDIERSIRVIKERFRSLFHRLPYKCITKQMVKYGAMECVRWLNSFPTKGGISNYYSPRTIITGRTIDYNKHCVIPFGSYVQASQENNPTNTTAPRTIGCIYLRSLDTYQGGHELLNLNTNKIITRSKVINIPITQQVIERVEYIANKEGMKPDLVFKNRKGDLIQDDDLIAGVDDYDNHNNNNNNLNENDDEYDENDTKTYENDDDFDNNNDEVNEQEIMELMNDEIAGVPDDDDELAGVLEQDDEQQQNNQQNNNHNDNNDNQIQHHEISDDENTEISEMRRSNRISRPVQQYEPSMKGKVYKENYLVTQMIEKSEYEEEYALIMATTILELKDRILNKTIKESFAETYTLNAGIKKFGEKGYKAAYEEVAQLHNRNCFNPIHASELSNEEKRRALESLIFLAEKRDGRIKGRACADGRKQRLWIDKDDAASPTVLLESVLLTATIDAKENREVAIVDIPNAFVQTEMEGEKVIMKVRGKLAEMLVKIAPKLYRPFITIENGKSVLYLELMKALYGMLKSALLFYKKLRKDLESIGFKINPYDPCIANRLQVDKQLTVVWHVDDLKISHEMKEVVDDLIEWIKTKYEDKEIGEIKPSRGKRHDYLGMILDYSNKGEVIIDMKNYVENIIKSFPDQEAIKKNATTPAAEHLFKVNKNCKKLDEKRAQIFHNIVAKGLFVCKRARADIMTTIAFLCTRVREPDEDDWKKLI